MTLPITNEPEGDALPAVPGQEPAPVEPPAPEYVTKADLEAFNTELQEKLNKQYQGVQSQTDRYQQNVQDQVQGVEQQLRDLRDQGVITITDPQIKEAARNNAIDNLLAQRQPPTGTEPGQAQPGQDGGQPEATPADINQQINAAAAEIERQNNVKLDDGDPEIAKFEIDKHAKSSNPLDYLRAIEGAVKAKAERVKAQGLARTPSAIQGGPGPANPLESVTDVNELWERTPLGRRNR